LGPEVPVKAVVARVEGYKKRFTLVGPAVELSGLEIVELFAARFRQVDGFRDLKKRLGWEECRTWSRNPIERTSQYCVGIARESSNTSRSGWEIRRKLHEVGMSKRLGD
jgi:hypothetical protein